eukprot:scpid96906/ scgid25261/ 
MSVVLNALRRHVLNDEYTYEVYIDLDDDSGGVSIHQVTVRSAEVEVFDPFDSLDGAGEETIRNIYLYKCKLSPLQITQWVLYHSYIVFETDSGWWSIEKSSDGLTIQRSAHKAGVRNFYRGRLRTGLTEGISPGHVVKDAINESRQTLSCLLWFLRGSELVARPYNLITHNSKDFTRELFDHFARSKTWESGGAY